MRIKKINRERLQSVFLWLTKSMDGFESESMADKLVFKLIQGLWKRVRNRLETGKVIHDFTLNEQEAMALYVWFQWMCDEMAIAYMYETMYMREIYHSIDKKYA